MGTWIISRLRHGLPAWLACGLALGLLAAVAFAATKPDPFPGAPHSQRFNYGSGCPAAPANRYLTTPAGCLTVRLADVDGDGRPDLVLLYTRRGVKNLAYHATLEVYRASGGVLTAQLPVGDIPPTILQLRNVNDRPGDEIFIHTDHISTDETMEIYAFNGTALQRTVTFLYGGYDVEVKFGITCHPAPEAKIVQDEFSTNNVSAPPSQRIWQQTATIYRWFAATLKRGATISTTFKRAGPPPSLVGVHC